MPTVDTDDPSQGSFRNSFSGGLQRIARSERGALVIDRFEGLSKTALTPLEGGAFLHPLYYQLCRQHAATRVCSCAMLSGNLRYNSTLAPKPGTSP